MSITVLKPVLNFHSSSIGRRADASSENRLIVEHWGDYYCIEKVVEKTIKKLVKDKIVIILKKIKKKNNFKQF